MYQFQKFPRTFFTTKYKHFKINFFPQKLNPFSAFSLFYFINLISILTYSPIQIDDPSCSTHQKRSLNPLHFEDFGDWQQFKIEFSNWNTTYQMRKPKKDVCAEGNVNTLIIVISKPDNFYAREQIRQTWMYDEVSGFGGESWGALCCTGASNG